MRSLPYFCQGNNVSRMQGTPMAPLLRQMLVGGNRFGYLDLSACNANWVTKQVSYACLATGSNSSLKSSENATTSLMGQWFQSKKHPSQPVSILLHSLVPSNGTSLFTHNQNLFCMDLFNGTICTSLRDSEVHLLRIAQVRDGFLNFSKNLLKDSILHFVLT